MEKLIYLLWASEGRDPDRIKKILLDECAPRLLELGARILSMNIHDSDSDIPTAAPTPEGEQPLAAEVCIWLDCHDRRKPFEEVLERAGCRMAGYLVTESLYTDYGGNKWGKRRDWPDGQRSPGVLMVTVLEKPERLTYEEWIEHWYGVQSPVSEEIQPRMRYVRNAVARPLTEDAPPILGIVDEAFPSAEHVTNPMLFFCADGSEEKMKENILRMAQSVLGFLDLDRIRSVAMSEYLLKT